MSVHGHDHLAILLDQQNEYLKMFDGPIHCGTGLGDAFKHLKKLFVKKNSWHSIHFKKCIYFIAPN